MALAAVAAACSPSDGARPAGSATTSPAAPTLASVPRTTFDARSTTSTIGTFGTAGTIVATTASSVPSTTVPVPADLSSRPLVWFAPLPPLPTDAGRPYLGSEDYGELFAPAAAWESAAKRIGVFKLYGEWVDYTDLASLRAAVEGIAGRGMAVGVEAGPLDPTAECGQAVEGFAGSESGRRLARKISDAGGVLHVIALDEPWYFAHVYDGPNACHWPIEQVAQGVADFVAAVREEFPWVIVGDIEPTPSPVAADGLAQWIDAYTTAVGEAPAFLHLDVDWSRPDWPIQTLAVENAARERGVPFGLIYNGGNATSDPTWLFQAGSRVITYEDEIGGRPDHVVFQSWMDKPDRVLPETDPSSFTALVNRYFDDRDALDAPPAGNESNVALGRPVTASSAQADGPAEAAVDGDGDTLWNAGAGPPATIEVDLGSPIRVTEVRLRVSQFPAGATTHRVSGREVLGGPSVELGTADGSTADNDVLTLTPDPTLPAVRFVRVETVTSPSWVAWREIEVFGEPG